jgi:hypothetical protein
MSREDKIRGFLEETDLDQDLQIAELHPPVQDSTPFVRLQSQHEEGSDPATFKIGDRYQDIRSPGFYGPLHGARMVLPHPRYPNPGEPTTPEIEKAFWSEWDIWSNAIATFRDVVRHLWAKESRPSHYDADLTEKRTEHLRGLWQGRNMTLPSDSQWAAWVQEYDLYLKAERERTAAAK